jgi:hypothetical protein
LIYEFALCTLAAAAAEKKPTYLLLLNLDRATFFTSEEAAPAQIEKKNPQEFVGTP